MSEHTAEKAVVCDGCRQRPCVCVTVSLPSADKDAGPTFGPRTDVREVECWSWVKQDHPHKSSVGHNDKALLLRAQRIFGGRIEVIRQTITTVTTVYDETPGGSDA